jgi:hypothetical protein
MNLDDPHLFRPRSPDYKNAPKVGVVPTYPPLSNRFKIYVVFLILAGLGLLVFGVTGMMAVDRPHQPPVVTPYTTPDPTP